MDGIDWAVSAMKAARTRLDVAAENLANASTDGFRKSSLHGFLTASGVRLERTSDNTQGALRGTGRPFDLAITGRGEFKVRAANGTVTSTRDGAFMRDRFGRLVDAKGRILMGSHRPIIVPDGAIVDSSGAVISGGKTIGRLELPAGSSLRSGFLETSNTDAIGEMIDVLTAQRSFETAEKVLSAIDQSRERAVTQTAQVKA